MKSILFYGGIVIMVIIAVILMGEIVNDYYHRKWDGVNRFTMVMINNKEPFVQILSIDPETTRPIRVNLPGDLEIKTISGKGMWKIKSLAALSDKNGVEWAADSVAYHLGIPYTAVKGKIGIWDKISWWNLSRNVSWQEINLGESAYMAEYYAPDGDRTLGLTKSWQDKAGDIFYSSNLAKEELKAEVYNTTNVIGLANKTAQILENAGIKVTVVDQSDLKVGRCLVVSLPDTENERGIKWITNNFRCNWKSQTGLDIKEAKVYLGQDYAGWLNGSGG